MFVAVKHEIEVTSFVNAGEILQRLAGVKVQHGRSKKAPDIGGLLACRFSFLRGVVQRWV